MTAIGRPCDFLSFSYFSNGDHCTFTQYSKILKYYAI